MSGLTFALTSFACVGPFVGSLLAASVQVTTAQRIGGMATFATGLALGVAVLAARELGSEFVPRLSEGALVVNIVRLPGTSLEDASRRINEMGAALDAELPRGNVELVLTNVGSPNNARSAMTSPNWGPHMGFIRLALSDPEQGQNRPSARSPRGGPGQRAETNGG